MSPRLTQFIAIVLCGTLIFASSTFTSKINQGRKDLNMYGEEQVLDSTPPEFAFAIQAFGAFRGILTNIAFVRAEQLKDEGRYFDAMQLASWICKLQPRFPSVWEFQSWNMAWNISVTTYTPEERWNWVYNGVKLVRDEGIKYNPRAINLYKQIAWIFVNKMSESTDEYHMGYKRNWAWRMHLVLGPPPDPLGDYRPDTKFEFVDAQIGEDALGEAALLAAKQRIERLRERVRERGMDYDYATLAAGEEQMAALEEEQKKRQKAAEQPRPLTPYEVVRKSAHDWMQHIADSPVKLADLYQEYPETRQMVADLRGIGAILSDDTLAEDQYWNHDTGLAFKFFYRYRVLTDPPSLLSTLLNSERPDPDKPDRERLAEILGIRKGSPAGRALVRWLQKKVLHDVYKMDAGTMAELMATFGPMDWRVVDASSLYWVNQGLVAGDETINKFGNDRTNTARMIFFSLRNLMRRNKVTFEPYTDDINYAYLNFNVDVNFIEPMHQAFIAYGTMIDPEPEKKGVGATFRTGHINFLAEAIRLLWFANRKSEAQHYYDYLRDTYGAQPDGSPNPRYLVTLDEFVINSLADAAGTYNEARNTISGLLYNAWDQLADDNRAQYRMAVETARVVRERYQRDVPQDELIQKMTLPPIKDFQIDSLGQWLTTPAINPDFVIAKARLWANLTSDFSQPVYDGVIEPLTHECEQLGLDVKRAFPEPEGMADFRKNYKGRSYDPRKTDVDTPAQNQ